MFKKLNGILMIILICSFCLGTSSCDTQEDKDRKVVEMQQDQYAARQPVPIFDWSLERHLVIQLYSIRNKKVATHAVWRGDMSVIEGDCPSIGFGIPYDTSLTNPLQAPINRTGIVIEQAEPNGLFASKQTSATWVMCSDGMGGISPIYVEGKVTVYPYPVSVDYDRNRVTKAGASTVTLNANQK
jgi:hypothetical protein